MKVGLIGLGVMGRNHLRVLATLPDVEIVAISDPVDAARDAALAIAPSAHARFHHAAQTRCMQVEPVPSQPSPAHWLANILRLIRERILASHP